MYRYILSDLDGTLLNTIRDLTAAGNHVCEAHGWPTYSPEQFQGFIGGGLSKVVSHLIPPELQSEELCDKVGEIFSAYYGTHSAVYTEPYPGLVELMKELRAEGVQLAVLTNKAQTIAQELIDQFYPGLFTVVAGACPDFPTKPHPAQTNHLLAQLGAKPEETLYIGDSSTDVETAHNAALKCCAVTWGFRSEESLVAAGADFLAHDASELAKIIRQ